MNKFLLFLFCIIISITSNAQFNRYVVKFKNKNTNPYSLNNPIQYLTQRALDRRSRYNLSIDSIDLPVTPRYIDSIRLAGNVTILNVSKWLNQVSIQTTDALALAKINSFSFVSTTQPIASRIAVTPVNKILSTALTDIDISHFTSKQTATDVFDYGLSNGQVKIHQGQFLHNHGFRGEGMQLAVIDAGFYHYNTLVTFDSIRSNNQILGTWDFVANEASVSEDDSHGMHCLSTIAANMPGVFVGTAPKTSFYLFRSEDVGSEYPIEEHNFALAAERADSLGVDVCSTSLGYSTFDNPIFDYTYNDMNGNTTISARAADIAAKKGMLLVLAAGNEGNNSWHYIITPADADSVLAIAAVDTLGNVASFSSYGPSSDGQIKPAVAAVGRNAVVANSFTGFPSYGSGTSYACPNMAGITTCLWQAFPEANNMQIINALETCASNFNTPNDRIGYGIPDAKKAFVLLQKYFSTNHASFNQCKVLIDLSIKTDNTMSIGIERKFPTDLDYSLITTMQNNGDYSMHQFSYTDDLTGTNFGTVSYRFKMTIGSDTTFYIDSAVVNYSNNCTIIIPTNNSISITPNPVSNFLNINIERISESKIDIIIYNAAGQKVYATNYTQEPGSTTKLIDMYTYGRAVYFVSVFIDGKKEITKKILRQ